VEQAGPIFEFWKRVLVSKPGWILVCVNVVLGTLVYYLRHQFSESPVAPVLGGIFWFSNLPGVILCIGLLYLIPGSDSTDDYGYDAFFRVAMVLLVFCVTLQWLLLGRFIEYLRRGPNHTISLFDEHKQPGV
jgi:hypothetical protein